MAPLRARFAACSFLIWLVVSIEYFSYVAESFRLSYRKVSPLQKAARSYCATISQHIIHIIKMPIKIFISIEIRRWPRKSLPLGLISRVRTRVSRRSANPDSPLESRELLALPEPLRGLNDLDDIFSGPPPYVANCSSHGPTVCTPTPALLADTCCDSVLCYEARTAVVDEHYACGMLDTGSPPGRFFRQRVPQSADLFLERCCELE